MTVCMQRVTVVGERERVDPKKQSTGSHSIQAIHLPFNGLWLHLFIQYFFPFFSLVKWITIPVVTKSKGYVCTDSIWFWQESLLSFNRMDIFFCCFAFYVCLFSSNKEAACNAFSIAIASKRIESGQDVFHNPISWAA